MPLKCRWTKNEIKIMNNNYLWDSRANLLKLLPGRSWVVIKSFGFFLGLHRRRYATLFQENNYEYLGEISSVEWSYIAGFIDGEGHLQMDERKWNGGRPSTYFVNIKICNTNKDVMDWISKKLRIRVCKRERHLENKKWKDTYNVDITSLKRVYIILSKLLPYLIIKRDKAIEIIDYIEGLLDPIKRKTVLGIGRRRIRAQLVRNMYADQPEKYAQWEALYNKLNLGGIKRRKYPQGF
jgi:hypothetical protein